MRATFGYNKTPRSCTGKTVIKELNVLREFLHAFNTTQRPNDDVPVAEYKLDLFLYILLLDSTTLLFRLTLFYLPLSYSRFFNWSFIAVPVLCRASQSNVLICFCENLASFFVMFQINP